jgi:hypothetical protein
MIKSFFKCEDLVSGKIADKKMAKHQIPAENKNAVW